ncbi:MAG: peptidoglycan-binding domain-containing protein [Cypionkella sp.]|nr:peptidoglycan-binding domain-containing protein [Cypionkella sp.]
MGKYQGRIDGQIGRQSRAAISALQTEMGIDPNGLADAALMTALGVPAQVGPPNCVTVDLPARPEPPKPQCDRATTISEGGECLCRYQNMFELKNGVGCGCVKGTKFVVGKGCVKPPAKETAKPKETPPSKPKGPKCDAATTVLRGGKCVCSKENYLPISPTECAPERNVKRECPKGLVFLKGMGCVDRDVFFGDDSSEKDTDRENPDKPGGCKNLDPIDGCMD